jgi:hypothetical protein
MKSSFAAIVLLGFPALCLSAGTETVTRRGEAFSPKTGRLLWLEEHRETWVDGRPEKSEVVYSSPDAKPFARKTLAFGRLRGIPDFRLEDSRDGYVEGAENDVKGVRLFCRRKAGKPIEAETHRSSPDLVADAGVEEYIRSNWDRLVAGEKLEFRFAVPYERDFFRFNVRKVDARRKDGKETVRFRLSLSNPLLRAVADPIDITWDSAARRVVEYEGLTAINDERGKSTVAKVVYRY